MACTRAQPSGVAKLVPGELHQLAVDLAIAAGQQKAEHFQRQLVQRVLARVGHHRVGQAAVVITELEFKSLASEGYNRIPLMAEAFADLETPLSLYLKLAHTKDGGKHSFLLESVVGGERFGRYSFIGLPARTLLRASGFGADARTEVVTDGQVVETARGQPAGLHRGAYQKRFKVALRPGLPRFCGGLAGYFGYDAVRYIEKKLEATCPPDTLDTAPTSCCCSARSWPSSTTCRASSTSSSTPTRPSPRPTARAKKRLRD
jgi:anthranilate synthase component 1